MGSGSGYLTGRPRGRLGWSVGLLIESILEHALALLLACGAGHS